MNFTVFGFIFMLNLNLCSVIVYVLSCYGCILTNVLLFRLSKRGFKTFRFLGLKAVICFKIVSNFLLSNGLRIGNVKPFCRFAILLIVC